ncbi:unnamed protein product [Rotaria socialis]|nr:unnamed protein product [Rotaria socialis]CAF4771736.1 unnamed protein product [Rotaria socialis]
MTLTKYVTYITTKFEINVVLLEEKKCIVKYGTHGYGPNKFNRISYLFIAPNDATSLYIVDCAQYFVHQCRIDDTGLCFGYVRKYVVIANVLQRHISVSCVILNGNLLSPISFSPGLLCAHDKYLYVANRSSESSSILVFNEQYEIVDWFRNPLLNENLSYGYRSSYQRFIHFNNHA